MKCPDCLRYGDHWPACPRVPQLPHFEPLTGKIVEDGVIVRWEYGQHDHIRYARAGELTVLVPVPYKRVDAVESFLHNRPHDRVLVSLDTPDPLLPFRFTGEAAGVACVAIDRGHVVAKCACGRLRPMGAECGAQG